MILFSKAGTPVHGNGAAQETEEDEDSNAIVLESFVGALKRADKPMTVLGTHAQTHARTRMHAQLVHHAIMYACRAAGEGAIKIPFGEEGAEAPGRTASFEVA